MLPYKDFRNITGNYRPFGSGLDREDGTHLTSIIRSIQAKLGQSKSAPGWEMSVCADMGFLWERALQIAYIERRVLPEDDPLWTGDIMRPDPICLDGVWMSPDGFGVDPEDPNGSWANHEYKITWRSSIKQHPLDDFYWCTQFQCYARALGADVTIIHVMYTNGDYRGSGPQHRVWRVEWYEEELEKTWAMILREKEEMGK